ncbi:MAG: LysR family transcriptional regulator, partial [Oscillospiraceae bacterium]|nr:LysR family transcriptional regulator [Oscillospiraceae bacterium]
MDLLQLKYFSALAKSQHLNRTAEEMLVTPSAVSASLARLEKELGVKLFDRVGRNIRLNQYGKILSKYTDQVFTALDSAKTELREAQNPGKGSITVAITNPNLWNKALHAFYTAYPEIFISLTAFDTGSNQLYSGHGDPLVQHADFYIAAPGATIHTDGSLESEILFYSQVLLAVSPKHRFARRKSIDLAEARDEWFVNSPYKTSFRTFCDNLCQQAGFTPKSRIECDYMLRPRMLINENMVCLATSLGRQSGLYEGTVMIPIEKPPCSRPQAIYWRAKGYQSRANQVFKEFLLNYCRKMM